MNEIYVCKLYRKKAEVRRQMEAEEQARRIEQRRREPEALCNLQKRSIAPFAQTPHVPSAANTALLQLLQLQLLLL